MLPFVHGGGRNAEQVAKPLLGKALLLPEISDTIRVHTITSFISILPLVNKFKLLFDIFCT
jgi:hypothetical protein